MRLKEITRPKTTVHADEILHHAGYKRLGSGLFATVYHKPGQDTVLKLFRPDMGYIQFVNTTLQHPNIHFPKFRGKLMKVTPHYYAIRMELLEPLTSQIEMRRPRVENVIQEYIKALAYNTDYEYLEEALEQLELEQPGIKQACEILANNLDENNIDLHYNNIMLRGNTIVITDPFLD